MRFLTLILLGEDIPQHPLSLLGLTLMLGIVINARRNRAKSRDLQKLSVLGEAHFYFASFPLSSPLFHRRIKEVEQKSIEEEANKRIEELVAKRVEEELERRRDEIEAEVLRRVEEAKAIMEAQMMEELEKRKQEQLEEAKRREVRSTSLAKAIVDALHKNPNGGKVRFRAPAP